LGTPLLPWVKGIEMPLSDQASPQGHFDFLALGFFISLNLLLKTILNHVQAVLLGFYLI